MMMLNDSKRSLSNLQSAYRGLHTIANSEHTEFASQYRVIWCSNNTRLLEFDGCKRNAKDQMLFIPSLINKGYILDIMKGHSLIEFLSNQECNCFLIDWGDPDLSEVEYTMQDYYNEKILKIICFLQSYCADNITLVGHCLGGILAIIAATLHANFVKALVLIATPWDFSCYLQHTVANKFIVDHMLKEHKLISSLLIKSFFLSILPAQVGYRRLMNFISMTEDAKKQLFLKIEKWTEDSVYLSRGFLKECSYEFIIHNKLFNQQWKLNGSPLNLEATRNMPCFLMMGNNDTVVPYKSFYPLFKYFNNKHLAYSSSGHIGMLVGSGAHRECWQSLVNWCKSRRKNG